MNKLYVGIIDKFNNTFIRKKVIKINDFQNLNELLNNVNTHNKYNHAILQSSSIILCEFSLQYKLTKTKKQSFWKLI